MRRLICVVGVLAGCNVDASGLGESSAGTRGDASGTGVATEASTAGEPSTGAPEGTTGATTSPSDTTGPTSDSTSSTGAGDSSSGTDTGDPPMLACEGQLDLAACYDFAGVGEGTLVDRSGNGNDGQAAGVGVVAGPFGDAATFDDDSRIEVEDSASLDITGDLTMEVWVRVDALPSGRGGLLDDEGQYSLIVYDTGEYRCDMAPGQVFAGPVVVGEWSHVACVYDGAALRLYVNGDELGTVDAEGAVATDDGNPVSIGDTSPGFDEPLDGAIGGLRVWGRALDANELCEAAGSLCSG